MRRRKQELAQPSDIAFLLIIFFLLLSGIEVSKSLDLQSGNKIQTQSESISLTIHSNGEMSNGNTQTSLAELEGLLNEGTSLSVFVEGEALWQAVVDVLSIAQRHQVASILVEMAL
ncbi:biopolymer transport protein [Sphaerochaeta pleomorpha str. Grapes]|uniref:Biopolymer transport protein n=1 Tax=Sphaerochaeta pleomorpha (strain ATCC BAA-1885 / DSM 22778 / Grapes) TaxID=158190 RepID=G8QUF9_SPHPG|nr:biopolymer transporter ExbD [Sphaerochaeta pleomorpha]AEV29192.1 biopolymer transport protein [Sphaerochaeta pleomorpha str. Grapes]